MSVHRGTRVFTDYFDRAQALTTTPGYNGWTIAETVTIGVPTYLCVSNVGLVLTIAADDEIENVCAYQNNVLCYTLAELQQIEFIAKVSGIDATTTLVFGIGSARADDPDAVVTNAWFRMEGSASTSLVVAETDDGVSDLDDKATAVTLSSTFKKFTIDFERGLSDIRFMIDGQRVAQSTTFTLGGVAATTGVQPIIQLSKTGGTGAPVVTIRKYQATLKFAIGA